MLYQFANNGRLSGRADGNVYMRNGRIRGMVVPALVQNGYTTVQRGQLSVLSAAWRALTAAQQVGWNSATGFTRSDRFGEPVSVTGKRLFIMLNMNLFNVGRGTINDVPAAAAVPGITNLALTAAHTGPVVSIAFTPTPTDSTVRHLIFATAGLSPGVYKPKASAFRLFATVIGGTASPVDLHSAYVTKFGTPVAGQVIFAKTVPIQGTTGQAGVGIVSRAVVGA